MERFLKIVGRLGGLALAVAIGYALRGCSIRPVTVASQSPDYQWRVSLVERPSFIDRNFEIQVEDIRSGKKRTVFRSPDEGRPGSEGVIWSVDGSRFMLTGRSFSVTAGATLTTGEQIYLMMDLTNDNIWCNASQQTRYPRFGLEDLGSKRWLGWVPPPNHPLDPPAAR